MRFRWARRHWLINDLDQSRSFCFGDDESIGLLLYKELTLSRAENSTLATANSTSKCVPIQAVDPVCSISSHYRWILVDESAVNFSCHRSGGQWHGSITKAITMTVVVSTGALWVLMHSSWYLSFSLAADPTANPDAYYRTGASRAL